VRGLTFDREDTAYGSRLFGRDDAEMRSKENLWP
jgi:hypothetical protein